MLVEICIIYYMKINYKFRPFSLAIFRLIIEKIEKHLVGSYTWLMSVFLYSGEVSCGLGMRSRMLCRMGGMNSAIYCSRYIAVCSRVHITIPSILHNMRDLIPSPQLTSPLYKKSHISQVQLLTKCFSIFSIINLKMANEKGRNM